MFVRRVHRVCGVAGCMNLDSFYISKYRLVPGTVIMCKDCLKEALADIEKIEAEEAKARGEDPNAIKPEEEKTQDWTADPTEYDDSEVVAETEPEIIESVEAKPGHAKYACPNCGREFKTSSSLKVHMESVHGQ